jgi:hypothetical protein
MSDLPKLFYLLVDYPALIFVPIVTFAALALWSKSRTAWVATAAWNLYLIYELGEGRRVLQLRRVHQANATVCRLPAAGSALGDRAGAGLCLHP